MPVRSVDNTAQIANDTRRKASLAIRYMLDGVEKSSRPGTPKDSNDLRNSTVKRVQGLKGRIQWTKLYAVIQEVRQFQNYTTPGTGPHYAENAIDELIDNPAPYFRKAGIGR